MMNTKTPVTLCSL